MNRFFSTVQWTYTKVLLSFICLAITCHGQQIKPPWETITYTLIANDADLLGNNQDEVQRCMDFMSTAANRVTSHYSNQQIQLADKQTAIGILRTIDSVFSEYGFLFYTKQDDIQFDYLTLAFRNNFPAENYRIYNWERQSYWSSVNGDKCHLIDCDLYCFIYFGIAEMLSLPIKIVELPRHNFIRWKLPSGESINWEVIEGKYHPQVNTLSCYYHLAEMDNSSRNNYLIDWTNNDVLSYYYTLRASTFDYNPTYKNPIKAKRDYEKAIKLSSSRPYAFNNYVWMFVVYDDLQNEFDLKKLIKYIDHAIALQNNLNFYDTKAAVYAQTKDFKRAIKCIKNGLQVKYDPDNAKVDAEKHLSWFKQGITVRAGKQTLEK